MTCLALTIALALCLTVATAPPRRPLAAAEGQRQPAVPRHRGRHAVLLPRRHRLGAVPPPQPRGGRALPRGTAPSKGFTVIQAVALAEFDGLTRPERLRPLPLANDDPTTAERGLLRARRLDRRDKADALGLYIGMLPTWGDKWNKQWGAGPEIFTPENAAVYGEWLGRRYRDKPASSGFSAATAASRTTRTRRSSGRWRAGCAQATAART